MDYWDTPVSPFWRFAPELSIVDATLLILNIEPQGLSCDVESRDYRPDGYDAVKSALVAAVRAGELQGRTACYDESWFDPDAMKSYSRVDREVCDVQKSFVNVKLLKEWLLSKGHGDGYFFPQKTEVAPYLNSDHHRYAPKLAAAVNAWMAFDPEANMPGTPKQRMQKWLRLNAPRFGLTADDGKPSENMIEEIARLSNWATAGGAPKVTIEEPVKAIDFSQEFDEKIPF